MATTDDESIGFQTFSNSFMMSLMASTHFASTRMLRKLAVCGNSADDLQMSSRTSHFFSAPMIGFAKKSNTCLAGVIRYGD
ncbi:hypothetical protein QYF36_021253 [Acer negundo]|nr:hypothetical protein QYF36_021253 [Acer negundo]